MAWFLLREALPALLTFIAAFHPDAPSSPSAQAPQFAGKEVVTHVRVITLPVAVYEQIDRHTRPGVKADVAHGGAFLTYQEVRRLFEAAQTDERTNIMQFPPFQSAPGQPASWCSEPIRCQVIPLTLADNMIGVKIAGLTRPDHGGASEGITFNIQAAIPKERCVLFGGRSYSSRNPDMVLLFLADAQVAE